ncbi:hypothetical protein ACHQM5_000120 [Ranunculus cassubicifolius]
MPSLIKSFLFLFIILLLKFSGEVESTVDAKTGYRVSEGITAEMKTRKLKAIDIVLDYDYGGANSRHDPRKGRGGSKVP